MSASKRSLMSSLMEEAMMPPAGGARSADMAVHGMEPSPKRLKYITPGGTPSRETHASQVWAPTPQSAESSAVAPATHATAGGPGAVDLPPQVMMHQQQQFAAAAAMGGFYPGAPQFVNQAVMPFGAGYV